MLFEKKYPCSLQNDDCKSKSLELPHFCFQLVTDTESPSSLSS